MTDDHLASCQRYCAIQKLIPSSEFVAFQREIAIERHESIGETVQTSSRGGDS